MKVLIFKTSSLGDLVHTLPALTDAGRVISDIQFDWVVEENFVELPGWHPLVDQVIPISLRRWRKSPGYFFKNSELRAFKRQLQARRYDTLIDAQGLLLKSAIPALWAHGPRCGYSWSSAREALSSLTYSKRFRIARDQHAVERVRQLFAASLDYSLEGLPLDFGLQRYLTQADRPYLVFLHGTTWDSKHWPEAYWQQLAETVTGQGYDVLLPWGSPAEELRAVRLSNKHDAIQLLPAMQLTELRDCLAAAQGVVGLDSGLTHLSAALGVPTVTLYGSTSRGLTGTRGDCQNSLSVDYACAPCLGKHCRMPQATVYPPCYQSLPPMKVWENLEQLMARGR